MSISAINKPRDNQAFTYDALNRLLNANTIYGTFDYTYDDVGNRLTRPHNGQADAYTYQAGTSRLEQITGVNQVAFGYDANGNITGIDDKTFEYNQNNGVVRVDGSSGTLGEYTYNGFGQREIKEVDGVTTIFHYDFDGNIIAESESDSTMRVEYLYVDQSRMAMVDSNTGDLYTYNNNYLGTPILMTDDTGTVVWEADYKPFGEAAVNWNSSVVNNFRFAGQYFDQETGFHYNWHRYFDPKTGRYLTPDPIGLAGGINLYAYASNNPINKIDPLGLAEVGMALWGNLQPGQTPHWTPTLVPIKPSLGVGGVLYIFDVNWNTSDPVQTNVSLATPQLAGGTFLCFSDEAENEDSDCSSSDYEPGIEEIPFTYSIGSRYMGISFTDNFNTFCINVGLAWGLLPVNASSPSVMYEWQ